jgi:gas vesicle protein
MDKILASLLRHSDRKTDSQTTLTLKLRKGNGMSEERDMVGELITTLKQQRDELALKIHLGKEDAKDEWEKAQEKLSKLADEYEPVKEAVEESASNVFASLKIVAGELMESFTRIKDSITEEDA